MASNVEPAVKPNKLIIGVRNFYGGSIMLFLATGAKCAAVLFVGYVSKC